MFVDTCLLSSLERVACSDLVFTYEFVERVSLGIVGDILSIFISFLI